LRLDFVGGVVAVLVRVLAGRRPISILQPPDIRVSRRFAVRLIVRVARSGGRRERLPAGAAAHRAVRVPQIVVALDVGALGRLPRILERLIAEGGHLTGPRWRRPARRGVGQGQPDARPAAVPEDPSREVFAVINRIIECGVVVLEASFCRHHRPPPIREKYGAESKVA
jgi:hypothetical protein